MIRNRVIHVLGALLIAGLVTATVSAQERGAKAIFYSGEGPTVRADQPARAPEQPQASASSKPAVTPPSPPVLVKKDVKKEPYMALSFWVELVGQDGQKQRVTAERIFRSGERIKLRVVSNRDGYLYLVNVGSTGKSTVLFPHPSVAGGSSFVKASTPYEIPPGASIRFDENPGVETLLLILSTKPLEEGPLPRDAMTRSLTIEETRRLTVTANQKGAKDLVLELDSESAQPASYAAAPLSTLQGGQMITLEVKLKHE